MTAFSGIMITNGGPHSAEKWAFTTGEMLFPIDSNVAGDRLIAAKKVQLAIIEALIPHHDVNMTNERNQLSSSGDIALDLPYSPEQEMQRAFNSIVSILKTSPWAYKAVDPEWEKAVKEILASHFATSQNIERQWHCHRSGSEKAQLWLSKQYSEG